MKRRFLRTLMVIALLQFFVTRQAAGRSVEEGRAERMWMLYPFNVIINAALWTLVFTLFAGLARTLRRLL